MAVANPPVSSGHERMYIHGPQRDLALSLAWVPFAIPPLFLTGDGLIAYIGAVLLWSFCHQPITALMVYGDPANFALKRRLFLVSPVVFMVAILVGMRVSIGLVAAVGGLWNAEHTLMQRYGVTRIYGRKANDDHGRIEKVMLFSWLAFALVFAAADPRTPALLERSGLTSTNRYAVELLTSYAAVARLIAIPLGVAVAAIAWRWWQAERAGPANPGKRRYLASTAALFVTLMVHPIAGVAAYVGSHALEYFVIVHRSFGTRYARPEGSSAGGPLAAAVRTLRLPGFFAAYGVATLVLAASIESSFRWSPDVWAVLFFGIGGMHVFYDGFIWKLRQPAVAASLRL